MQRLQTGLFGIAGVLLVVGLANVINDRARLAEESGRAPAEAAVDEAAVKSDPLADIGVVPSAIPSDPDPAKRNPAADAPR